MSIHFDLPPEAEQGMRKGFAQPLEDVARDLLLAEILGLSSLFGAERWLAQHGLDLNYGQGQLDEDRVTLERRAVARSPE